MKIPNAPKLSGLVTGTAQLDRFLREMARFCEDIATALRSPEPARALPIVLYADLADVSLVRGGQLFAVPDHPDGYRLGISDGDAIQLFAPTM